MYIALCLDKITFGLSDDSKDGAGAKLIPSIAPLRVFTPTRFRRKYPTPKLLCDVHYTMSF